jgi:hypothetical protein
LEIPRKFSREKSNRKTFVDCEENGGNQRSSQDSAQIASNSTCGSRNVVSSGSGAISIS